MPASSTLRPVLTIASLLLVIAITSACGGHSPRQIRGELPAIHLDSLTRTNDRVEVDIGIRNLNDSPLTIPSIQIALTVNDEPATELIDEQLELTVGARGREVIRLTGSSASNLDENLDLLTSGERSSLPWSMDVELGRSTGRGTRQTEANGFLHRVPGRLDSFR